MSQNWKQRAKALADSEAISWREIAGVVGKPKSTVSDYLRQVYKAAEGATIHTNIPSALHTYAADVGKNNQRILHIPDLHAPYHHSGALAFLEHLKKKYEPTRVIGLGDEVDAHSLCYHERSPDLHSAKDELEKAKVLIRGLEELFPEMDILESNHGSLAYRRSNTAGIPRAYMKGYNEVLGVGQGWKWHSDMLIKLPNGEDVYYHHGKSNQALKVSQQYGCSHVCGHYHESMSVQWWSTPKGLHFALHSGCLIDRKSLAFAYAKNNMKRPIIGATLIIDSKPVIELMEM